VEIPSSQTKHKCEVAKLGSKAGYFLSGKRGGGGERDTERKRERDREKERESKRESEIDRDRES
jgi:hypothetical protein